MNIATRIARTVNDRLLHDADEEIARWVLKRLPAHTVTSGQARAVGVIRDGRIVAGVLYTSDASGWNTCVHIAAVPGSRWASRPVLMGLFSFAFDELCAERLTAVVDAGNAPSLKLARALGFVEEGRLERWHPFAEAVHVFRMFPDDCRWL